MDYSITNSNTKPEDNGRPPDGSVFSVIDTNNSQLWTPQDESIIMLSRELSKLTLSDRSDTMIKNPRLESSENEKSKVRSMSFLRFDISIQPSSSSLLQLQEIAFFGSWSFCLDYGEQDFEERSANKIHSVSSSASKPNEHPVRRKRKHSDQPDGVLDDSAIVIKKPRLEASEKEKSKVRSTSSQSDISIQPSASSLLQLQDTASYGSRTSCHDHGEQDIEEGPANKIHSVSSSASKLIEHPVRRKRKHSDQPDVTSDDSELVIKKPRLEASEKEKSYTLSTLSSQVRPDSEIIRRGSPPSFDITTTFVDNYSPLHIPGSTVYNSPPVGPSVLIQLSLQYSLEPIAATSQVPQSDEEKSSIFQ